ncbi:hypothetical protein L218DRAFT_993390 [Marasmius fiardii PR-910]|nr:hypothetical protein L218DRAFT_993390 [Marasmius fiardii PR-910]
MASVVEALPHIISLVNELLNGISNKDKLRARGYFTQRVVQSIHNQYPNFNAIIVHPKHECKFEGIKGVDWDHFHINYYIGFRNFCVGYDVYVCKNAEFCLKGDGGNLNWAFSGLFDQRSEKHVKFSAP